MAKQDPEKILIDTYNEIDAILRSVVGYDGHLDHGSLLKESSLSNPVVARHMHEMRSLAQLRNTVVHNPFGAEVKPLITPNDIVVDRYQSILKALKNPPSALTIAVPGNMIFSTTLDANLNKVLKEMDKNIFTHVPVIEDKKMTGILSENAILSYIADMEDVIIDKETKVEALKEYLPLDVHRGESFAFLPRAASLEEVFKLFNEAIQERVRIGMVFITENGKDDEKPVGILTAWDLANFDLDLLV